MSVNIPEIMRHLQIFTYYDRFPLFCFQLLPRTPLIFLTGSARARIGFSFTFLWCQGLNLFYQFIGFQNRLSLASHFITEGPQNIETQVVVYDCSIKAIFSFGIDFCNLTQFSIVRSTSFKNYLHHFGNIDENIY